MSIILNRTKLFLAAILLLNTVSVSSIPDQSAVSTSGKQFDELSQISDLLTIWNSIELGKGRGMLRHAAIHCIKPLVYSLVGLGETLTEEVITILREKRDYFVGLRASPQVKEYLETIVDFEEGEAFIANIISKAWDYQEMCERLGIE